MANKEQGIILIELIMFIAVFSILIVGILRGVNQVLRQTHIPQNLPMASFLADARMQLILLNRRINGFTGLTDPCASSPPAACTPLSNYAKAYGYTVTSALSNSGDYTTIKVVVSGTNSAFTMMTVSNYDNS